jgi:hypothetical protein
VIFTALIAHLIIPIRVYINDKGTSFVLFLTAACFITFIDTLLYVYIITGIKFFMKRWSPGFIFVFSIIAVEWAESYI